MVPKGFVLWPLLFTLYMQPLGSTICHLGLRYHMCADDTHLLVSSHTSRLQHVCITTQHTGNCVKTWMSINILTDNKTEVLTIAPANNLNFVLSYHFYFLSGKHLSQTVQNLDVTFDISICLDYPIKKQTMLHPSFTGCHFELTLIIRSPNCATTVAFPQHTYLSYWHYHPVWSLQSACVALCSVWEKFGRCFFYVSGPTVWILSAFSSTLEGYESDLKTNLIKKYLV